MNGMHVLINLRNLAVKVTGPPLEDLLFASSWAN